MFKVAITMRTLENPSGFQFDAYERGFNHLFAGCDITPIANRNQDFEKVAADNDFLVISGGDDHPTRLMAEVELIKQFRQLNKPILGVCHGAFLLTQLWDGECFDLEGHRRTTHTVFYDKYQRTVNSYHGSGISSPPPDATTLVVDADNNVEAWISYEKNAAAVVWHPERDVQGEFWLPSEILNLLTTKEN